VTAELLVGIDVGTTMTKAAVVGTEGTELAWGRCPTPWRNVATGAETDATRLLDAVNTATAAALRSAPPGRVAGVGVTSMAETAVLLGAGGQPAAPCVAWHDVRGEAEAADLAAAFGAGSFSARTGLPVSTMCTLVKLAWLWRHSDARPTRALNIADWLVHVLGGEQAAEASLSSRTGALSLAGRRWWVEGLEWAGTGGGLFPDVVQAGACLGRARGLHGGALARLEGAALASAGHDHLCVAAGAGALGPAEVLDSCGTAEAFVRAVSPMGDDAVAAAVGAGLNVSWHTVPGHYAVMGGQALGLLLERVLELLGVRGAAGLAELDQAAASTGPGPLRVTQEGAYSPASISGLGPGASPAALWRAALDHTADGARRFVAALGQAALGQAGGPACCLVLSGGWAGCAGVRRGRQDLLGEARWPAVTEAGARGAALFGGCAAGVFSGPAEFPGPAPRRWDLPPFSGDGAEQAATVAGG
jgi:sugar (pentulose or hexulose) kinase